MNSFHWLTAQGQTVRAIADPVEGVKGDAAECWIRSLQMLYTDVQITLTAMVLLLQDTESTQYFHTQPANPSASLTADLSAVTQPQGVGRGVWLRGCSTAEAPALFCTHHQFHQSHAAAGTHMPNDSITRPTSWLNCQHGSPACLTQLLFKAAAAAAAPAMAVVATTLLLLCNRGTAHAAPACFAFSTSNSYRLMISS